MAPALSEFWVGDRNPREITGIHPKKFKKGSIQPYFAVKFTKYWPKLICPPARILGPTAARKSSNRSNSQRAGEQKMGTVNLWISIFFFAPGRPRLATFYFFPCPGGGPFQKSAVLKTDFFEDARPEIHLKRRATDTSETWGVEKRLKFKKAPFSTHPRILANQPGNRGKTAKQNAGAPVGPREARNLRILRLPEAT